MRGDSKIVGLIGSILFLLVISSCYFWLWIQTRTQVDTTSVSDQYQVVEIDSIKNQATKLLDSAEKDNISSMPLTSPTSEMIGRENPFAGL